MDKAITNNSPQESQRSRESLPGSLKEPLTTPHTLASDGLAKNGAHTAYAEIPLKKVGPIKIKGPLLEGEYSVPLATYETPLWASCNRGAKISRLTDGIQVICTHECMTRSVLVEGPSALEVQKCVFALDTLESFKNLSLTVQQTSRFATLQKISFHPVGRQLFIRIEIYSGDASGHNMATKAAEKVLNEILKHHPILNYVSLSGNACCDKKVSAINSILGRGRSMIAEIQIPRALVLKHCRTTPEKLCDINLKKNLLGSHMAGSLRSANAHVANTLLAFYLATGQDAANIVEGSQAITTCEVLPSGDLYFALTLPNLIMGTVGNGKHLPKVQEELAALDLLQERPVGENSRRLAALCAATTLCSELSLLAALTNPEELMRAHTLLERSHQKSALKSQQGGE
jgi:hydroxymethylglutaryl-CoA reductase (NADPH)